jgi:tRNA (guanine-N7-)-methyltransferase
MGRKNKLAKFEDIRSFANVLECYDVQKPELVRNRIDPVDFRGAWSASFFANGHPITLELACGAGEYAVGLAQHFQNRNFIGVDLKGNRIWKGAKQALEASIFNVGFLRTQIEVLHHFFNPAEIDEIWITFADPFPRPSKSNRRLTSPFFLDIYRKILRPGGLIHVKHDDQAFYDFTLETIANAPDARLLFKECDIYAQALAFPELQIQTKYEGMHLEKGRTIKYVQFALG